MNEDFGKPHPALNTFLHWLQETQNATRDRISRIDGGQEAPRRRKNVYVRLDDRISAYKTRFVQARANIPIMAGFQTLLPEIQQYLYALRYLWNNHD
jgi:hypothetical protein